jgi:hypothetical protein
MGFGAGIVRVLPVSVPRLSLLVIDEAGEPWLERDVVLADPVEAAWVDAAPKKSA